MALIHAVDVVGKATIGRNAMLRQIPLERLSLRNQVSLKNRFKPQKRRPQRVHPPQQKRHLNRELPQQKRNQVVRVPRRAR